MTSHQDLANAIRALSMDAVQAANSGHPGMPMGMADAATVLFTKFLKIDPSKPDWPNRDRFILSAGHGSMLLYSLHHLLGYTDMTMDKIKSFRQLGAPTAGHPEYGHAVGIETTTGPLGQGLANAVGMAIAEAVLAARFGRKLVDHKTWVIAGDGCLMEGISHEAIDLAGHLRLKKLNVIWDDNSISIDGSTDITTSTNQRARFKASGWSVYEADGHDPDSLVTAFSKAEKSPRPSLIACKTTIGYGSCKVGGTAKAHGAPLGADEITAVRKVLNWPYPPFEIPTHILNAWRATGQRHQKTREEWEAGLAASPRGKAFLSAIAGELPPALPRHMHAYKTQLCKDAPKIATRKASQMALEVINAACPITIGGSADLSGSNLTHTSNMGVISSKSFKNRYIHYGVREHGMAAAMNGIALHKGLIPYGGTFLVFADYARGAMRLSSLMKQRVIYVLTHDSIGLGEDGPTHQPVEHLAMLRATPNLQVIRPCDAVETAEAWELALESKDCPTALILSRQGVPTLRLKPETANRVAQGGYVLQAPSNKRDVTLIATGTEVSLAMTAANRLEKLGIQAAVVSLPCMERFAAQSPEVQAHVLGNAPRLGIEAAIGLGWERWIGNDGHFIGMNSFGASGPAHELYAHFGITTEAIVETAKALI